MRILLGFLLAACLTSASNARATLGPRDIAEGIVEALRSRDTERLSAAFANDAVFIVHSNDRIVGRQQIARRISESFVEEADTEIADVASHRARIRHLGPLAVHIDLVVTYRWGDGEQTDVSFLLVASKVGGKWLVTTAVQLCPENST